MINSSTYLIEEIQGELAALKLHAPAIKESLRKRALVRELKKEYAVRYACMQGRYLRSSWINKLQFLTSLVNEIPGITPLVTLINSISAVSGKIASYAKTDIATNFVYDTLLKADNRALHLQVFQEATEDDIWWFKSLNRMQQVSLIIGLLRIGGGGIIRKMYEIIVNLCKDRIEYHRAKKLQASSSVESVELRPGPDISNRLRVLTDYNEESKYDTKDPMFILVEKERKKFEEMFKRYKATVESQGKPKSEEPAEEGTEKKSKKGGKKDKKDKNDKKKDKSSKNDKKKKGKSTNDKKSQKDPESNDWIQLLPIWIVKQIFGYLDKTTLAQVKKVSKYWEYVITDMAKEAATRIAIDKKIQKMEENINQVMEVKTPKQPKVRISITNKKIRKLSENGCTNQKLRIPFAHRFEESVLSSAPKFLTKSFLMPTKPLRSFPRNGTQFPCLYKRPVMIYFDGGFLPRSQFENEEKTDIRFLKDDGQSHQSVGSKSAFSYGSTKSFQQQSQML